MKTFVKSKAFLISLAATLFAAAAIGVGIYLTSPSNYMAIDVNPSIEVSTNRLGKVVSVNAVNDDAQKLLADKNLKGYSVEDAIYEIVEELVEDGYLSRNSANEVLLTVANSNADDNLLKVAAGAINNALAGKDIEANLLEQQIDLDDKTLQDAHQNGVSAGKHHIIQRILMDDDSVTVEELSSFKISDLFDYAKEHNIRFSDLMDEYADAFEDAVESSRVPSSSSSAASSEAASETPSSAASSAPASSSSPAVSTDGVQRYCDDCGKLKSVCKDKCNRDGDYCEYCGRPESVCKDACENKYEKYCDDCGKLKTECKDRCDEDGDYCEYCGKRESVCRHSCENKYECCDKCGKPKGECKGACDDKQSSRPASSKPVSKPHHDDDDKYDVCDDCGRLESVCKDTCDDDDKYDVCDDCGRLESVCKGTCDDDDDRYEKYCDDCGKLKTVCKDSCNEDGDYCEYCGKPESVCQEHDD